VRTVAGEGPVDRRVPALAVRSEQAPDRADIEAALHDASIVVLENICSLPLNEKAAAALAAALRGRRALLHHHDLPWQQAHYADLPGPPDDPAWLHVTINERSRGELAERGIAATTIYNTFDTTVTPGDRATVRRQLGVGDEEIVVLQPTRAIARKNVAEGLALAEALGAVYWLLGPAEDGYGPQLDSLLSGARTRVVQGAGFAEDGLEVVDAYAACDVVTLPSTWEGFGNPALEAAVHRRPLAIGHYPIAAELASFGFRWFPSDDPGPIRDWLRRRDADLLEHNAAVAEAHFGPGVLRAALDRLLTEAGWSGPRVHGALARSGRPGSSSDRG
jgi:glycosyltransferase involved in cell wall biosynthesis